MYCTLWRVKVNPSGCLVLHCRVLPGAVLPGEMAGSQPTGGAPPRWLRKQSLVLRGEARRGRVWPGESMDSPEGRVVLWGGARSGASRHGNDG